MNVFLDIETYSSVDLAEAGVTKYAASPDFEILMLAYAVGEGPVQVIDFTGIPDPRRTLYLKLSAWMDAGDTLIAYNASFEYTCLRAWLQALADEEWQYRLLERTQCAMATAAMPKRSQASRNTGSTATSRRDAPT